MNCMTFDATGMSQDQLSSQTRRGWGHSVSLPVPPTKLTASVFMPIWIHNVRTYILSTYKLWTRIRRATTTLTITRPAVMCLVPSLSLNFLSIYFPAKRSLVIPRRGSNEFP